MVNSIDALVNINRDMGGRNRLEKQGISNKSYFISSIPDTAFPPET